MRKVGKVGKGAWIHKELGNRLGSTGRTNGKGGTGCPYIGMLGQTKGSIGPSSPNSGKTEIKSHMRVSHRRLQQRGSQEVVTSTAFCHFLTTRKVLFELEDVWHIHLTLSTENFQFSFRSCLQLRNC